MTNDTPLGRNLEPMTNTPRRYQVIRKANGVVVSTHETFTDARVYALTVYRLGEVDIVILTQPEPGASFLTEGSAS